MKFIQDELEQPLKDILLIRYMDEWKYKSMKKDGLAFTQLSNQYDSEDGIVVNDNSGLARMLSNREHGSFRDNCYISCWAMDDFIKEDRFNEYCKWKDYDGNYSKYAYAITIKYSNLIQFAKSKCSNKNGNYYTSMRSHSLNWGIIKYHNFDNKDLESPIHPIYMQTSLFIKHTKWSHENEFRISLTKSGGVFIPQNNNYKLLGKPDSIKFMSRFTNTNVEAIYRFDKETKEIIKIMEE